MDDIAALACVFGIDIGQDRGPPDTCTDLTTQQGVQSHDCRDRCGPVASDLYTSSVLGWCINSSYGGIDSRDRSLHRMATAMRARAHAAGLSEATISVAERMYKACSEMACSRGLSREVIMVGAVYAASRQCGAPRTLEEISKAFDADVPSVAKGATHVCGALDVQSRAVQAHPRNFVDRMLQRLPSALECTQGGILHRLVTAYAEETGNLAQLDDERPEAVAAMCVALAWNHMGRSGPVDTARLASGLSSSTIRKLMRDIDAQRGRLSANASKRVLDRRYSHEEKHKREA